ncbi:SigE family RNA polymerase sigma factor [Nocardioides speluncae]|uniref:SigE family RNA polymerase sigma factor n=1 Tax=Nocardioides speluncae TaxID=2670337 RepID=UPI000D686896|nr:SigE family RNA polymerase sigma factor [Nocardioides speluncae]
MIGRKRDDAAYVEFVASRQQHLFRVAYAVCGDWHQASDLLQTALTKLYVAWSRVHRDGREEAYVRQIIVRTNIDDSRRRKRRPETPGLDGFDLASHEELAVEERSALFEALQGLPPMQRKAVVLRHWLGLSVAETAGELGITEGTVKSHTSRGLEKLQAVLSNQ